VASTFEPGQRGAFVLRAFTSGGPLQALVPLRPEGDGLEHSPVRGAWSAAAGTAAGCPNHRRYGYNPVYRLLVSHRTPLVARLASGNASSHGGGHGGGRRPSLSLALFPAVASGSAGAGLLHPRASPSAPLGSEAGPRAVSGRGVYGGGGCGVSLPAGLALDPGTYLLVPSTFDPWDGNFLLSVYANPGALAISQLQ